MGEIINNSRTFARQVLQFGDFSKEIGLRMKMVKWQITWNWSLVNRLRKLGWSKEAEKYLALSENKQLKEDGR